MLIGCLLNIAHAAAQPIPGAEAKPMSYFYTGKPYDSTLQEYTFAYRNYSPEINRWTTADPSGFPDGVNNYRYLIAPVSEVDSNGLFQTQQFSEVVAAQSDPDLSLSVTFTVDFDDNSIWIAPGTVNLSGDTSATLINVGVYSCSYTTSDPTAQITSSSLTPWVDTGSGRRHTWSFDVDCTAQEALTTSAGGTISFMGQTFTIGFSDTSSCTFNQSFDLETNPFE